MKEDAVASSMTCIEITEPGGPEVLRPVTRARPRPGDDEVLVQVAAAGVNKPDCLQRQGGYPPPPGASDIPGLEVSGTIVAVGPAVAEWTVGDRVCALLSGGGYAEYAVAHHSHCLPIPAPLDMVQAAALPETVFTVWHNVFERGGLKPGETLLVHGGSSGIGTIAIQLGKAFGATVFATAGSTEKCRACLDLGADHAINYTEADYVDVLRQHSKGADVVLDMVGGDYLGRDIKAMAPDGRHVSIAFLKGSKVEIDFMPIMLKRLTFTGSTLRSRDAAFKARIAQALRETVWPLLIDGRVAPRLFKTFPLAEAAAAHALVDSSRHIGKVVLTVDG
jgi:putative PIG3 family NAD(P)H quinone oxidoreductase